jgi:hypothetical protein
MTTPLNDRLLTPTRLRLVHVREVLDSLLEDAAKRELSYADFLDGVSSASCRPAATSPPVKMSCSSVRLGGW